MNRAKFLYVLLANALVIGGCASEDSRMVPVLPDPRLKAAALVLSGSGTMFIRRQPLPYGERSSANEY